MIKNNEKSEEILRAEEQLDKPRQGWKKLRGKREQGREKRKWTRKISGGSYLRKGGCQAGER